MPRFCRRPYYCDPVDFDWALEQLQRWDRLAAEYAQKRWYDRHYAGRSKVGDLEDELEERHSMTQQILGAVESKLGRQPLIKIYDRKRYGLDVDDSLEIVRYAIGKLRHQSEVQEKLGNKAPKMRADLLHPIIWDASKKLWQDGHYGQAVQRAATFLNAHVQDILGRHDVSDASLMNQAFSKDAASEERPRLRWPGDPTNLTVRSMNEGLRSLAPGCFMTIRNPSTHSTDEVSEQEALEQLATLSLLSRFIDECFVDKGASTAKESANED